MMRPVLLGLWLASTLCATAAASDLAPPEQPPTATLQTVLVKGSQKGPGLWKVSSGENTLWILGTLSPLPKDMQWQAGEVEATIARSQEVLGVRGADPKIGVGTRFKMLMLAPSAMRTLRNPDKARLQSVLAPPLYARWTQARDRYGATDNDVETLRPLFASQQLYWKAVEVGGLETKDLIAPVVKKAARSSRVAVTDTTYEFPVELDRKDLKRRFGEMNEKNADDIPCFTKTLDVFEGDVETMKLRANAWATGNVAALRQLSTSDLKPPCQPVVEEAVAFLGIEEIKRKVREKWLLAAQDSLSRNQSTFATLPISDLLDDNGVLKELRRRGYTVEAPDDARPEEQLTPLR
jgi:uncharacterized protein YbaP (TraB family)